MGRHSDIGRGAAFFESVACFVARNAIISLARCIIAEFFEMGRRVRILVALLLKRKTGEMHKYCIPRFFLCLCGFAGYSGLKGRFQN